MLEFLELMNVASIAFSLNGYASIRFFLFNI